jgi:hypothetical protein
MLTIEAWPWRLTMEPRRVLDAYNKGMEAKGAKEGLERSE